MGFTSKQLGQGRYNNTTNNTVYTVPASTTTDVRTIVFCNTTASAATFRLFFVGNGGTADESTALYYDYSLPANHTLVLGALGTLKDVGSTIQFRNGTANAITITVTGAEYT